MAKDTVAKVKKLFLMQPTLAAEMSEIKRMKAPGHQLSPECLSHYAQVENMYMALQSFYLLLSREQAEIIRLHFVGKITWEAMEIEYEKKWGKMNAKNIRTMKTYQAQAFETIAAFIDTHREYYDYSWLDELCYPDAKDLHI